MRRLPSHGLVVGLLAPLVLFAGAPAPAAAAGDAVTVAQEGSANSSTVVSASASGNALSIGPVRPIKKGRGDGNTANGVGSDKKPGKKSGFRAQACCAGGNGWAPGEPSIAVGKSHIVETVNSSVTVYAKDTRAPTEVFHQDLTRFFGGGPIACIDPRVIYWSWSDRYALVCSDIGSTPNVVRFAVSTSNDPSQGWSKYVIAAGFLDQPKIEATSDKLIVAGNEDGFEQFYVYQLEDVIQGTPDPAGVHLTSQNPLYQAAVQYTPTSDGYFVGAYACSGCSLFLATISGTPATSVSLTETSLGDPRLRSTSDPAVPGGTLGGEMDTRVLTAAYEVPTSDEEPVIQYSANTECTFEIDTVCTAIGRIVWSGSTPTLSYVDNVGSSGAAYTYGAVTLDERGRVYLSYSRSSATSMPSAAVFGLRRPGHHAVDTIVQSSTAGTTACDAGQAPPCNERWGDYMGAAQDPTDRRYVWLAGLYQLGSGPFGWATVIARAHVGGLG